MTYIRFIIPVGIIAVIAVLFVLWQRTEAKLVDTTAQLSVMTRENERLAVRNRDLEIEALERKADEDAIDKISKDMNDAISAIPEAQRNAAPSAASVALGCARLRAAGSTSDAFKRICGAR